MNFLLDHDVPAEIERILIRSGHEVVTVRQVMRPNALDSEVLTQAIDRSLILKQVQGPERGRTLE